MQLCLFLSVSIVMHSRTRIAGDSKKCAMYNHDLLASICLEIFNVAHIFTHAAEMGLLSSIST